MSKPEYVKHSFKLSEFDIKSIITAVKDNESINIRLTKEMFTNGNTELPLTKTELKKVKIIRIFYTFEVMQKGSS